MTFQASLYKFSVDREGEATIVLKVPASELTTLVPLVGQTQKELRVSIE